MGEGRVQLLGKNNMHYRPQTAGGMTPSPRGNLRAFCYMFCLLSLCFRLPGPSVCTLLLLTDCCMLMLLYAFSPSLYHFPWSFCHLFSLHISLPVSVFLTYYVLQSGAHLSCNSFSTMARYPPPPSRPSHLAPFPLFFPALSL